MIAAAILIGTALIGDWLLRRLGITLPAFRIAGGLLLFAVASEMVLGLRSERKSRPNRRSRSTPAIAAFPLAIPLMAGPARSPRPCCSPAGATPAMARRPARRRRGGGGGLPVSFSRRRRIGKLLGITGNVVLSRLLGVILAALAVQYVIDGVRAAFGF